MTVREYMNRAKAMQTSVKGYVDDIAMMKEDEIVNLNVTQMQDGLGTNDQRLKYPFDDYSGKYTKRAVEESLKKPTVLSCEQHFSLESFENCSCFVSCEDFISFNIVERTVVRIFRV